MKISLKDKAVFYNQLHVLIDSGLDILQAFSSLAESSKNRHLGEFLISAQDNINRGDSLSNCFMKAKDIFSDFEISLISTGEKSGRIEVCLSTLAGYFEKMLEYKRVVLGGLGYPLFLLHMGILIPSIPQLVLNGLGAYLKLVLPTLLIIYGLVATVYFLWKILGKNVTSRKILDEVILSVPILGPALRKLFLSRFMFAFKAMFEAGISPFKNIRIASNVCGNFHISKKIETSLAQIEDGKSISEAFTLTEVFPKTALDMIKTGEESGKIGEMVGKTASYFQAESEFAFKQLAQWLPKIIYFLIMGYVAFLIISAFSSYSSQIGKIVG